MFEKGRHDLYNPGGKPLSSQMLNGNTQLRSAALLPKRATGEKIALALGQNSPQSSSVERSHRRVRGKRKKVTERKRKQGGGSLLCGGNRRIRPEEIGEGEGGRALTFEGEGGDTVGGKRVLVRGALWGRRDAGQTKRPNFQRAKGANTGFKEKEGTKNGGRGGKPEARG